jgi:hypothetical protein
MMPARRGLNRTARGCCPSKSQGVKGSRLGTAVKTPSPGSRGFMNFGWSISGELSFEPPASLGIELDGS